MLAGGVWLLAGPLCSFAQSSKAPRAIAVLLVGTEAGFRSRYAAFRGELKRLGYVEGRDISFQPRWADDQTEKLPSLAKELASLAPAVILTSTSAGVAACKAATSTIPIVFATVASPVEQGFVATLRRPGGNITGVLVHTDLGAKIIEAVREALPKGRRMAMLVHESDPVHKLFLDASLPAAKRFDFETLVVRVKRAEELSRSFTEIAEWKADAICLPQQAFVVSNGPRLAALSREVRVPLFTGYEEITAAGGLLSYGQAREGNYRRAAALVDKILRGASPGELPVEQPESVQLIVNLKTARDMGLKLPQSVLQRADRVIQ